MKKYVAIVIAIVVFGAAVPTSAQSYADYYYGGCNYCGGQFGFGNGPYFADQAYYDNYNFGYNTYPIYNNFGLNAGFAPMYYQNGGSVVGGIFYGITSALLDNRYNRYYNNQYYNFGGYGNSGNWGYYGY